MVGDRAACVPSPFASTRLVLKIRAVLVTNYNAAPNQNGTRLLGTTHFPFRQLCPHTMINEDCLHGGVRTLALFRCGLRFQSGAGPCQYIALPHCLLPQWLSNLPFPKNSPFAGLSPAAFFEETQQTLSKFPVKVLKLTDLLNAWKFCWGPIWSGA